MAISIYFMKAKVIDENLSVDDIMKIDNCLQDNKEVEGIDPKIVEKYKKLRKNTYLPWSHELKKPLYTFIDYLYCSHSQTLFNRLVKWQDGKEHGSYCEIRRHSLFALRDLLRHNLLCLNYFTSKPILQFKEFYNGEGEKTDQAIAFSEMEIYYKSQECNSFFPDFSCFDCNSKEDVASQVNTLYAQNCQILGMVEELLSDVDFTTEKLFYCLSC